MAGTAHHPIMPGIARRHDLLRKRLHAFTRMLPAVADGDVRALHRARVASRRLRELVPVLELDHRAAKKLSRRLRRATARLGQVRELDVLLLALDEHAETGAVERRAVDRVRAAISERRARARTELVEDETLSDLRRLARKLESVLTEVSGRPAESHRPTARGWTWAIDARIARRAGRVRRAIEEAGTVYLPERLHDVRIALKKFRYSLELQADAHGATSTPELRALKRGQDLLGRLHDLQVLIAASRDVRLDPAASAAAGPIDRFVDAIETECRHLHAKYLRERATLIDVCDRAVASSARRTRKPASAMRRSA